MSARRIIIGLIVCFLVVALAGPRGSRGSRTRQRVRPPDTGRLRYMSPEERKRAFEEQAAQRKRQQEERIAKEMMKFKQKEKDKHDGRDESRNEYLKLILEVTEEQWKDIEPKINRIYFFKNQSSISMGYVDVGSGSGGYKGSGIGVKSGYLMGGFGGGSGSGGSAQIWSGPPWRLSDDRPLTEGEKVCEEFSELLEDENPDLEKIKQKIIVLRQAREKAREQLAKVRQELREMLNSRQEAILVFFGALD